MLFIHDTVSLCDSCYRHIPAFVFERDGQIWLRKKCSLHGESEHLVEPDAELFYSLKFTHKNKRSIMFEVTDKCQLECPHCYHLPDNRTQDKPIEDIISQLLSFPPDVRFVLAGAEPTLRNDFVEMISRIKNLNHFNHDNVAVLTNGIKFSNTKFTKDSVNAGLDTILLGLNHYSYNGVNVHNQQLAGIQNLIDSGASFGYIGYTVETLDHIPDILDEIAQLRKLGNIQFRIRCGAFIGRSSDQQRSYVSATLKKIEEHLGKNNFEISQAHDNNIYHINIIWNNTFIRVIQWPDVSNIDMEELNMEPYCQFYGKPITNFVHQVILRDAYKNKQLSLIDGVPFKYTHLGDKTYWKDTFTEPVEIDLYDYKSNLLVTDKVSQF